MKFIRYTIFSLFILWAASMNLIGACSAWKTQTTVEQYNPIIFLDRVYEETNKKESTKVQDTKMDAVTSDSTPVIEDRRFTISNTVWWVVENLHHYLQYVMFVWFAMATIFIIINWFKFVTKWEAHWKDFKKNIIYTIVWVGLLVAFYYIIDVFTALANMFLEK